MASSLMVFGILLCAAAVTGQKPNITSLQTPYEGNGLWIFQEAVQLNLSCYHPLGKQLHWGPVQILRHNPIYPQAASFYTSNELVRPIQLNITFDRRAFIPEINISCYYVDNNPKLSTTVLRIEQQYRATNVIINDGSPKVTVAPNPCEAPSMQLECKADGNPAPEFGSWYNQTEEGVKTVGKSNPLLVHYWNNSNFYQCEAKNFLNPNWVRSAWVEVSGFTFVQPSWLPLVLGIVVVMMGRTPSG